MDIIKSINHYTARYDAKWKPVTKSNYLAEYKQMTTLQDKPRFSSST